MAIAKIGTLRVMAQTKGLDPVQRAAVRSLLRAIVDRDFGGNQTRAAKELGVSQPFVSEVLKDGRGAGTSLLVGMRDYLGVTLDDVLHGRRSSTAAPPSRTLEYDDQYPNRARAVVAARALGYTEEAIAQVQGQHFAGQPDMEPEEWLDEIKTADRRLRRGVAPVGTVVASDLDEEPPGFAAPKRGKGKPSGGKKGK